MTGVRRIVTWLLAMALLALCAFAAQRIVKIAQADRWAREDPQRALRWLPDHPQALLALAHQQIADKKFSLAQSTARHLLAVAPLEGRAFRVLAEAAAAQGQQAEALALYRIAARRSPRDVRTRAWLIEHFLGTGDYPRALAQMDVMLRTTLHKSNIVLAAMALLAVDPAFAKQLARTLEQRPAWRQSLLSTLYNGKDSRGANSVLSHLRARGGLSPTEFDEWIAWLMSNDRWGEAYSRWASGVARQGGSLQPIYNGGFEIPVTGRGFDWRITAIPGVSVEFEPDVGAVGLSAHVAFRGRPVPQINLEQPLLLAPGAYRFSSRVRMDALRSDRGLEWVITCAGQTDPIANSARLEGTFAWRAIEMDVIVPPNDCQGQWLRLRNPAPSGSSQHVFGDVWLDDVKLKRQRSMTRPSY